MPRVRSPAPMLYSLRTDDIRTHQIVVGVCCICRHRADVPIERLAASRSPRMRDIAKRLRCTACGHVGACYFQVEEEADERLAAD